MVNLYHDEHCDECHVDQQIVEVGEYAPVDEGNACIVLIEENCQDRAGHQGRGEDETVSSLAESVGSWGHFVRLKLLLSETAGVLLNALVALVALVALAAALYQTRCSWGCSTNTFVTD